MEFIPNPHLVLNQYMKYMSNLFQNTLKFSLLLLVSVVSSSSSAQNEFAFDMHSVMEKENNLLFSPTCIKGAFALAFEGANNETQREFE